MGIHLLVFMGVAALVIVVPGPDTVVVTKNILVHGRRAALGTSLGVSAGLSVWTLAAAVGVASLVRASAVAFTVLKLVGALYLIWLGLQALRTAGHTASAEHDGRSSSRRPIGALGGFRQGFLSDLATRSSTASPRASRRHRTRAPSPSGPRAYIHARPVIPGTGAR